MRSLHTRLIAVCALLVVTAVAGADARRTASPPGAAVAAAHPMATAAGLDMLARGGNAFDAAIAIAATLAVVEPYSSGFGGGGFWLLHRAEDGLTTMVDSRERAPLAATEDMFLGADGAVDRRRALSTPLAAGIPGNIAAVEHLAERYGRLPLAISLAPAIRAAEEGFTVTPRYRLMAGFKREVLRDTPAGGVFLADGEIPALGQRIVQRDLAQTLRAVAEKGAEVFYRGAIARQLVEGVRAAGGIWSREDLAQYRVRERAPITFDYRGIRITAAAPPSSGGIVLAQALTILERFDLAALGAGDRRHLVIEAMRWAYRDRAAYLGDPDHVEIPTGRLLSPDYLAGRAKTIELGRATPSAELPPLTGTPPAEGGTDTTHFSVIDAQGNRVAATLSINTPFGAGHMPPGTGILLNNEMDDFAARRMAPNAYGLVGIDANLIAPGKRPLSSMTPTFVDDGVRVGIIGTPGGSRIISMVLLAVLEFAEGAAVADWVAAPRYHHQYLPDVVQFEKDGLDPAARLGLIGRGHALRELGRQYGNMHAIAWNRATNRLEAASDPRGEGAAAVLEFAAPQRWQRQK